MASQNEVVENTAVWSLPDSACSVSINSERHYSLSLCLLLEGFHPSSENSIVFGAHQF